jgi:hypothetical protein
MISNFRNFEVLVVLRVCPSSWGWLYDLLLARCGYKRSSWTEDLLSVLGLKNGQGEGEDMGQGDEQEKLTRVLLPHSLFSHQLLQGSLLFHIPKVLKPCQYMSSIKSFSDSVGGPSEAPDLPRIPHHKTKSSPVSLLAPLPRPPFTHTSFPLPPAPFHSPLFPGFLNVGRPVLWLTSEPEREAHRPRQRLQT